MKGKFKKGIEYEKAAQRYLRELYPAAMHFSVWFNFIEQRKGHTKSRWCQVDAIHLDQETKVITIYEMKIRHSNRAWWQLHTLYYPVLFKAFGPSWTYRVVEMTQICDPIIEYPTPVFRTRHMDQLKDFPTTNILIWRM